RPPNRSASVTLPCGPSNTYSFSTFSQGNSRRCRLSSSRNFVNYFSFRRNSFRLAIHSLGDTTSCPRTPVLVASVVIRVLLFSCLNWLLLGPQNRYLAAICLLRLRTVPRPTPALSFSAISLMRRSSFVQSS